jgi:hypothetical protein
MLSDDVYRAKLTATFGDLKQATAPLADVALIDTVATPHFIKLALVPHATNACAVEIMVRADQFYDIALGTEFYEDCPVETFDLFGPLIFAVAAGDVIQRRHISRGTGTEREVETIVSMPGGRVWRKGHIHHRVAEVILDSDTVFTDRSFVPYRRG